MRCEPQSRGTLSSLLLQHLPSVYYSKIWLLPSVNRYCPGPSYHYVTWITVLTFLLEVSQLPHCSLRTQQPEGSCENVSDPIPCSAPHPPTAPASLTGIHTIWSFIASLIYLIHCLLNSSPAGFLAVSLTYLANVHPRTFVLAIHMVSSHTLGVCPNVTFPKKARPTLMTAKPAVSDNQGVDRT